MIKFFAGALQEHLDEVDWMDACVWQMKFCKVVDLVGDNTIKPRDGMKKKQFSHTSSLQTSVQEKDQPKEGSSFGIPVLHADLSSAQVSEQTKARRELLQKLQSGFSTLSQSSPLSKSQTPSEKKRDRLELFTPTTQSISPKKHQESLSDSYSLSHEDCDDEQNLDPISR